MNKPSKETHIKAIAVMLEKLDPKIIKRIYDYVYRWSKRSTKGA